jgi:glycosyltransferase involved in cell wall biosynthesis
MPAAEELFPAFWPQRSSFPSTQALNQMTIPAITILVPVYNGEAHLKETLESLLAQTFTDFELLIINDGSTDSSAAIAQSMKDERIRLIGTENRGFSAAVNLGIQEARAPYIARSDHDDLSVPTRLERQMAVMREHLDALAVFTFNTKFGARRQWSNRDKFAREPDPVREYSPEKDGCILPATMLARAEALRAIGGFRPAYYPCDDFDLECRLSEAGKVLVLCEPLMNYRFHEGASTYRVFSVAHHMAAWTMDSRSRRLRHEPELTFEEFLRTLPADPWSRLKRYCAFSARTHMRIGGQRFLDGKYLAAAAHFSASALLNPGNIAGRIKRLFSRAA